MENRLVRLEADVGHIRSDVEELKADMRIVKADVSALKVSVEKSRVWMLATAISIAGALLAVMAHGFKWL